jgi:hypothetical protein
MDAQIDKLVAERLAQTIGVTPDELGLDEPLEGEDWEEELIEEICQEVGITPRAFFPPAKSSQRSKISVAGLRRLAPFSGRTARRLQEMDVRWEVTTIHSFIRSLEERRPVGSGR